MVRLAVLDDDALYGERPTTMIPDARTQQRVVVVDDDLATRTFVELFLRGEGFDVVGTAQDGAAGVELVRDLQPDSVVLDLDMPRMGGRAAIPLMRRDCPRARIVVYSSADDLDAGVLGADACVRKDGMPADLVRALRSSAGDG